MPIELLNAPLPPHPLEQQSWVHDGKLYATARALADAMAEVMRSEDRYRYVYRVPKGADGCVYAGPDGRPSCAVGHIVRRLGDDRVWDVLSHAYNTDSVYALTEDVIDLTQQSASALAILQNLQDSHWPWLEAAQVLFAHASGLSDRDVLVQITGRAGRPYYVPYSDAGMARAEQYAEASRAVGTEVSIRVLRLHEALELEYQQRRNPTDYSVGLGYALDPAGAYAGA